MDDTRACMLAGDYALRKACRAPATGLNPGRRLSLREYPEPQATSPMTVRLSMAALARQLRPRESVFIPGSSGEPLELTALLAGDPDLARQVRFVTSFVPGINQHNLAPAGSDRRMRVFFAPKGEADVRRPGTIDFCPFAYSTIQRHLCDPSTPLDTVIVQVSRPGADGRCSLGPAVEFVPGLLRRNTRVLAILNANVADLPGSVRIPMERFDCYALSEAPLAQYSAGSPNELSDRIAHHLLNLIPAEATLQIGLGKVPSQLLRALAARRNLSLHSGMLSDPLLDLAAAGALRSGDSMVTTVAVGSSAFYAQLPALPTLRLAGVDHTHDAGVLAQVPRLIAINSAIEVDLLGQVNAETIDGRYVSGPGGLPDFAHAARRCDSGLSIIALTSTDSSGRRSKITTGIEMGVPVTVPQHDVDAVVTEWGVALLRGCDVDERARRLVAVAHPEHREALLAGMVV